MTIQSVGQTVVSKEHLGRIPANILTMKNKETQVKSKPMKQRSRPDCRIIEVMEVDEKENQSEKGLQGRPGKQVTWSRDLVKVRSISPRTVHTPDFKCGHFVCEQAGGGPCQMGAQSQHENSRRDSSGNQRLHLSTPDYQNLPCSPQMQTVMWRSINTSRSQNMPSMFIQSGERMEID